MLPLPPVVRSAFSHMADSSWAKSRDAYESALLLLTGRPHSAEELRRKLRRKGFDGPEIAAVIERLEANGLVDDREFASQFAWSRLTGERPASARGVKHELLKRGVAGDVAAEAIEELVAEERIDEGAGLDATARKKLALMGSLEPQVLRRRLFGYLARKGYDLDDINKVIDRLVRRA